MPTRQPARGGGDSDIFFLIAVLRGPIACLTLRWKLKAQEKRKR
jgi:hypothetical protein